MRGRNGLSDSNREILYGSVIYTPSFSVYSAHPCIFLSNVVVAGKDGNPCRCSGSFSHSRHYEPNCLVSNGNLRIRMAGLCYDKQHV